MAAFVEKFTQQGTGQLRDVGWASRRQQRNSDRVSQVRFGTRDVKLLIRGDRRKTASVASAQGPGDALMVLVSPPLPAQRVIKVEHPDGTKRADIGCPAENPRAKRVRPVDTSLNGIGGRRGVDAVLESSDYGVN
ncbi:hypothetical protein [Mycobacterium sp.]|uniref:hypothetical protein n=1 Tax=Mycobacterium sp. TaxID=1785 RepID=UPI00126BF61D|nr:hypothetical protein [Mycobacterium sp.]KAA8954592.1 MAG: hypothetical protein F6Q13_17500 [Mycobacterium sp.]